MRFKERIYFDIFSACFILNITYNNQYLQWGSEIRPFEIWKHSKSALFEGHISNGTVFKWSGFSYSYSNSPNHLKTGPFKIWTFFQISMVFDKMAAISPDFKWLGFRISDPIWNPTSFWPFEIQNCSDFRSTLYQLSAAVCDRTNSFTQVLYPISKIIYNRN